MHTVCGMASTGPVIDSANRGGRVSTRCMSHHREHIDAVEFAAAGSLVMYVGRKTHEVQ